MKPPVVPGRAGAQRPEDDCRPEDACAACRQGGDYRGKRTMERHGNMRMMLCIDFRACNKRSGVYAQALGAVGRA